MSTPKSQRMPYVGPRPFTRDEQDLFFGRIREVSELSALVFAHPVVLLYAQSGAGKSSLINAGLVPELLQEGLDVFDSVRVGVPGPSPDHVVNIYAYNAFSQWEKGASTADLTNLTLRTYLKSRPPKLDEYEIGLPRVLIFDQFEELFTTFPERWEERAPFFAQLGDALKDDPLLHVVLSMREDHIAELDRFASMLPNTLRIRFRLERLKRDQALSAVIEPVRITSRTFALDAAHMLVDELRTIRVEKTSGEVISVLDEYVEPVVLQVVCDRLSSALPPDVRLISKEEVRRYASVDNALMLFYQDCVQQTARETGTPEDDIYMWFEKSLITASGTRHPVFREQEQTAGLPNPAVESLQRLHIIRADQRANVLWYELAHDRFVTPVRDAQRQRTEAALQNAQISAQTGLAERFRNTETRVRELRMQYVNGFIQREQFEAELRAALVLDDNQIWWMVGVESNQWHYFNGSTWIKATPPALRQKSDIDSAPLLAESVLSPVLVSGESPQMLPAQDDFAQVVRQAHLARRRRTLNRSLLILAVAIGLVLLSATLIIVNAAAPWQDEIATLANYTPQFQTARILAADGSLITELTSRSGGAYEPLSLAETAPELIHAVISTEDPNFYDDPGWNPITIAGAFIEYMTSGHITIGANTITQQIARNQILQDETVSKLQEFMIMAEIARRYDRDFILELYLNEMYFGNQSYGVEAASQFYFGHSASDLNLPEAALLAGLIQAPARYDPVTNRSAAFERMDTVLERMAEIGCLQFQHAPYDSAPFCVTQEALASPSVLVDRARIETANYTPRTFEVRYPHFVNYVQAIIEQSFGTDEMFRRGFTITTTLDPRVQDAAQTALIDQIQANAFTGMNTGAIMVTDPRDGAIRAMIGSPNFRDDAIGGQVNNVFTWQQPGSAIKPILYTAALEGFDQDGTRQYLTPASILWDVPTRYEDPLYEPLNFDRRFRGPQAVRYALQNSLNVPAVKTLAFVGMDNFRNVAERMGINFLDEAEFSLASALGANEVRLYDMMLAYGTLANTGVSVPLHAITSIITTNGEEITLTGGAVSGQVIQPQVAYLMQNILSDNNARADVFGLNSGLVIDGYPGLVGAKTGTSNDNRDLWTMGFTRNAVVGVWLGRVDNGPTTSTTQTSAVPVWNTVMRSALEGRRPDAFTNPGGVVVQTICADTGTVFEVNIPCTTVRNELFLLNQPPPPASTAFLQTISVNTWTGYRANQYCPDGVVTDTFVDISDPTAVAWLNTANGQAWAQIYGIELPIQTPPENSCTAGMVLPLINISAPANDTTASGSLTISGTISAPNLSRYELHIASLNAPDQYQIFVTSIDPVTNGVLGTLDTSQLENGLYRLRLAAYSNSGGYVYRETQFSINNLFADVGENSGEISAGEVETWLLPVTEPMNVAIAVLADSPAGDRSDKLVSQLGLLDTLVRISNLDGEIIAENDDVELGVNTDSRIENLQLLPGNYLIEVRSYRDISGGTYRLLIETAASS